MHVAGSVWVLLPQAVLAIAVLSGQLSLQLLAWMVAGDELCFAKQKYRWYLLRL